MIEIWVTEKIFKFIHEAASFTSDVNTLDYLTFRDGIRFLKERKTEMQSSKPTKHIMTRAEAIELFKEHMPWTAHDAGRVIDFYIAAGMLEIKEEEDKPIFEIKAEGSHNVKIWANGRVEGISGTIINRIPELIAKLKQNNS